MEKEIYLDNAATTKVCESSAKALAYCLTECYGNPSSLHKKGVEAQTVTDNARKIIAASLGCDSSSIYFTSGATESSNLAIFGTADAYGKRKKRIVTTAVEHPSVKECCKRLTENGFDVVFVEPRENGTIHAEDVINAVDENTCLVTMMLVNNETGTVMPVKEAFRLIKRKYPDTITHCDAVQGYMKLPVKAKDLSADLISVSGHKVHAPKGIGALYIKKGVRLIPRSLGGGQEKGYRSGTESVPLIAGFGAAVEYLMPTINERYEHAQTLRKLLCDNLNGLDYITFNSPENASPYVINFSVIGVRSEIMLHFLESKGIYVSSGSACSKGAKSGILELFGVDRKAVDYALRVSVSEETTEDDIIALCEAVKEGKEKIINV